MSSSNCCFLTCIQISQKAGQIVWYSHLLRNFPQFVVIHTVKDSGIVNKAIKFGFGKCSGALSCPNHWASSLWLSYKTHFLSHVTIQLSNGSFLLCRIREDDTSNWGFFFIFQATHEASTYQAFLPFQFASDANDIKWLMLSFWQLLVWLIFLVSNLVIAYTNFLCVWLSHMKNREGDGTPLQ